MGPATGPLGCFGRGLDKGGVGLARTGRADFSGFSVAGEILLAMKTPLQEARRGASALSHQPHTRATTQSPARATRTHSILVRPRKPTGCFKKWALCHVLAVEFLRTGPPLPGLGSGPIKLNYESRPRQAWESATALASRYAGRCATGRPRSSAHSSNGRQVSCLRRRPPSGHRHSRGRLSARRLARLSYGS